MTYTKYLFTPHDLAIFIRIEDLTRSRQAEILTNLFDEHNAEIVYPFREDFTLFRKAVNDLLIRYGTNYNDLDEAQMIMDEVNGSSTEITSDPDYYGAYFKLIKLRLLYKVDYCKIKMSTLLSNFGYQRRSAQLVTRIKRAINKLGIVPQIRGYETCDLSKVKIDTMIIFRLTEPNGVENRQMFSDDTENFNV